jgi:hypothetical protein
MLFKLFVLLRIPISFLCLIGYAGFSGPIGFEYFGVLFTLALFGLLACTSGLLLRGKRSGLTWAGWLVAAECVGAFLLALGPDIRANRLDPLEAFAVACFVLVVWGLPNAFLFLWARRLFVEPAKEKPGL